MTFLELGLSTALVRATSDLEYAEPTPIQAAVIPAILKGQDVLASAKTGSGKTAAFLLPILEILSARRLEKPPKVQALIIAPTRELVLQIAETIRNLGCRVAEPLKTCVAIGGVSINPQMMALRGGADVVVATPGRLLDLVAHNAVRLSSVQALVLDEADRLLALGFAEELAGILALLPPRRQNLLFSATISAPVAELAEQLLRDPLRVNLDGGSPPNATVIVQRAIEVDARRRTMLLRHLIETNDWSGVLVFVATKYGADHVAMKLNRAGIPSSSLHGELSQGARTEALAALKQRRIRVLVATDVAARGLDIEALPVVVNYDLPRSPADYVHRIGRTGRAGEKGTAISFISADTDPHFRLVEKKNRLAVAREQIPGFEPVEIAVPPRDPNGGVKGRGKSKKDKLREAAARVAGGAAAASNSAASSAPLFPWTPPTKR